MPKTDIQQLCVIGEKLRAMRKKQQMSLRELASRANVSASMLSQIETGKAYPSVRSIYSIAAALAVPVDYFFPVQEISHSVAFESTSNVANEMTASEMRQAKVNQGSDVASTTPHRLSNQNTQPLRALWVVLNQT